LALTEKICRVAHDARVLRQRLPELVRLECELRGLEVLESLLEARPFRLDHAPGEAGGKHALRHFRQHAVVLERREGSRVRLGREKAAERRGAPLARLGAAANGFE
jgi:hypothetical protein